MKEEPNHDLSKLSGIAIRYFRHVRNCNDRFHRSSYSREGELGVCRVEYRSNEYMNIIDFACTSAIIDINIIKSKR